MPVPQRALIVFDYIQNCLGGLSTGSSRACNLKSNSRTNSRKWGFSKNVKLIYRTVCALIFAHIPGTRVEVNKIKYI